VHWRDTRKRHDVLTIPTIWAAALLSLLVHVAALWLVLPRLHRLLPEGGSPNPDVLAVQLAPPSLPSAPPAPAPSAAPTPRPAPAAPPPEAKAPRPRAVAPRRPAPPVIALQKPSPSAQPLPLPTPVPEPQPPRPPEPAIAPPAPAPPVQDLAAYIDARRRERGEPPAAAAASTSGQETEEQRRERIVAANTGMPQTPTFGRDPRNAGGIFEIREMGYDYAQFYFFGFDKDIGRRASQLVDVRKGSNSDIRIAIVRKMIEIIRGSVNEDFEWISRRLGRQVTLSARPSDNAALEEFIMRDVFPEGRSQ
jgi:outer membrane biosynthesis protein TonB